MKSLEERVRSVMSSIEQHDKKLADEGNANRRESDVTNEAAAIAQEFPRDPNADGRETVRAGGAESAALVRETIVLRKLRPVLEIRRGATRLKFADKAESSVWRERLQAASQILEEAIRSVGRVEVKGHPDYAWIGTGWLVEDDIVVTNRHVAIEFCRRSGNGFEFKPSFSEKMQGSIDFLEEFGRPDELTVAMTEVLHIEDEDGPDLAFLRVRPAGKAIGKPIALAEERAAPDQYVAAIGYPARDGRIPDIDLMDRIFGNVYDKKRLAPGQLTTYSNDVLMHNCSTLGGNSGSVILDLESGKALGLHFAGRYLAANYAVPGDVVAERLRDSKRGRGRSSASGSGRSGEASTGSNPRAHTSVGAGTVSSDGNRLNYTVPIHVSIQIGATASAPTAPSAPPSHVAPSPSPVDRNLPADAGDDDVEIEAPRSPEDYDGRSGYDAKFIGERTNVPLPAIEKSKGDILSFRQKGRQQQVLQYEHFSVVMSRSRRMCIYSAVNIDGDNAKKARRTGWRTDPRISKEAQISKECYGNSPKFARGHMTRREDPIWGKAVEAKRGNDDSMHVTNAVPQMQPFNAGIWLGLEDYALQNARADTMRISVFTGPFFAQNDPMKYGVSIPRSFWKVIAFIHDDTGKLCATGYTMDQSSFLREEEFVFGQHETAQIPIATIEARAGLSFGKLADLDPLAGGEEAIGRSLTDFSQIRFLGR